MRLAALPLPLPVLALLASCATAPVNAEAACRITREVRRATGTLRTAEAIDAAFRASGARSLRVVEPDEAVTMDYRPDRLTITIDATGRIATSRCG